MLLRTKLWLGVAVCTAIILGVGLVAGCAKRDPNEIPVITTVEEYNESLARAEKHSKALLDIIDAQDLAPSEVDKADLKKALREFDGMIAFAPTRYPAYIGAGKISRALDDPMAAKRYFEAAISNLPRNLEPEIKLQAAECYHQLSQIQLELGDPREASDDSDKANGLVPNSPAYITGKASVMLQMKDYKNARRLIDQALKLDSNYRRAQQLLVLLNLENTGGK
ncbi:MAG: hypothetical protein K8R88_00965 [Armatimonadetes bacterium]|nr:hypothetical protein [Armatimonadota bacterium]